MRFCVFARTQHAHASCAGHATGPVGFAIPKIGGVARVTEADNCFCFYNLQNGSCEKRTCITRSAHICTQMRL